MITSSEPSALNDAEFRRSFEALTLPAGSFSHEAHVRLAYVYLREHELFAALDRYRTSLRRFAKHHGAPNKYHETVTCALVVLIHERLTLMQRNQSEPVRWEAFAEGNPDLLRWLDGAFFDLYPRSILQSKLAREVFVLPPVARETT